jgi:DNA replication protein DnaC
MAQTIPQKQEQEQMAQTTPRHQPNPQHQSTLQELASRLLLTYIRDNADDAIKEARHLNQDHRAFLLRLLTGEIERRAGNGVARRIKDAKFPIKKYIVDFDKTKYDSTFLPKFNELETLQFIDKKENIILIGTPGAGKTHYAIALGILACMQGKNVLFASLPNLIVELREAMNQNQLNVYRKRFERYHLVILDELGYISFDKSGCEMLFHLLTNRHGKGSVIVTTNLPFERWESIFIDPVLTGAMIDRLAHKAHVLDISREHGGRFEETIAWMANKAT